MHQKSCDCVHVKICNGKAVQIKKNHCLACCTFVMESWCNKTQRTERSYTVIDGENVCLHCQIFDISSFVTSHTHSIIMIVFLSFTLFSAFWSCNRNKTWWNSKTKTTSVFITFKEKRTQINDKRFFSFLFPKQCDCDKKNTNHAENILTATSLYLITHY